MRRSVATVLLAALLTPVTLLAVGCGGHDSAGGGDGAGKQLVGAFGCGGCHEIADVESGRFQIEDSPLHHAPHTTQDIAADSWTRAYTRAEGCFPKGTAKADKYWPPVSRVDNVYGDRNLVCVCPPIEEYAEAIA